MDGVFNPQMTLLVSGIQIDLELNLSSRAIRF